MQRVLTGRQRAAFLIWKVENERHTQIRSDQLLEYVKEQHDPANIREDSAPERSTPEIDFKDETLDKGSEINTEQLEVSADQLDAIRSQQSKRALEEARAAAAEIERQRLEVVAQEKLEEDQRPAENRIW